MRQFEPDTVQNAPEVFFAAYVGPSMNPTLREPEIMEITPYTSSRVRAGDVALYLTPGLDRPVVHRIIRINAAGIATFGDNNSREDEYLLQPTNIKGRVAAAWRGQKRRKIAGGFLGRLTGHLLHWRRTFDRSISPLLHPLYQALSDLGLICRLLPETLRPRVVIFRNRGREQLRLLLGQHIIGRYDQNQRWQIRRPFKLFVDDRSLQELHDRYPVQQPDSVESTLP